MKASQDPEQRWREISDYVTGKMKDHTRPFVVPLSVESVDNVIHKGTGSLIRWSGKDLILTCHHVGAPDRCNFLLYGSDQPLPTDAPFTRLGELDAAVARVSDRQLAQFEHSAVAIPADRIAQKHVLAWPEELLFVRGYAAENTKFAFEVMETRASGYVTQQKSSADALSDDRYIELHWDPQQSQFTMATDGATRRTFRLDNPAGMSGSLVWNTRYLECTRAGKDWTPSCAVVTGLLERWDTGTKSLLITDIACIRAQLDEL